MENSATNSQSGSTNRILNDIPQRDLDGGGISIKCLRKIFKVSTKDIHILAACFCLTNKLRILEG